MKRNPIVLRAFRCGTAAAMFCLVAAGFAAAQSVGPRPGSSTTQGTAEEYSRRSQSIILGRDGQDQGISEKLDRIATQLQNIIKRLERLEAQSGGQGNSQAVSQSKDDKAKSLLTSLDIITKGEQRVESLRKQLFDLMDKEGSLRGRITQLDVELRAENIDRNVAFSGSLRPEELREAKRKALEAEKKSAQQALTDVLSVRTGLEGSLQKAEALLEKLRQKFEKDIDAALVEN